MYRNQRVEALVLSRQSFTRSDGLINMKIVPKILATGLAISFAFPIKPVKPAVPLILAPVICAKVCVLVGTTIVGGVTAYIWQHRTTKRRYIADIKGNVRKMLEDPEEEELGVWEDPLNTYKEEVAEKICRQKAIAMRANYRVRRDSITNKMICVFTGGDSK